MRRLTTLPWALTVAALLLALPPSASGERRVREPVTAVQATDSSVGLVLLARPGWARVESELGRTRIALGQDETLTAILETRRGWVAAGVREDDRGTALVLLESRSDDVARLPALARSDALQLVPVLLGSDGELAGAAWLEGDGPRALKIRFAEWTGVGWGPAETVSRPGPGSQTGLVGTTLRNGEILLAWSRYDGSDDEIFWSRRAGGQWSAPRRVGKNNKTPDITPTIARSGRGAVLVWARMDGDQYRILSRRYRAGEWKIERSVSAPGAVFPSLVRTDDSLLAVYRTAAPRGWSVAEIQSRSGGVRTARIETPRHHRPVVTAVEPAGPVVRWPEARGAAQAPWDRQVP